MYTGENVLQEDITLYFEREEYLNKCMYKYVLVDITKMEQIERCYALLWHPRLKFHLQGTISLRITSLTVSSDAPLSMCPEDVEEPDCENFTITGYNNTLSCSLLNWPGQCRLDFEPNCNASLGYREVTYNCPLEPMTSKSLMILYPVDMYELDLSNNYIMWLGQYSFTGLNNLHVLYLEINLLTLLPNALFRKLNKLLILRLHDNKLSQLEEDVFMDLQHLSELYLNRNELVSLHAGIFRDCGRLIFLNLEENKLTSLPQGLFHGLHEILFLSFVDNKIQSLDTNTFKTLGTLWYLFLNENRIKYLPLRIFQDLKLLQLLDLSTNQIDLLDVNIFRNTSMLIELYLTGNELQKLPEGIFEELKMLQYLGLDDNHIEQLDANIFKDLNNLKELYLSGNVLQTLPSGVFEDLKLLNYLNLGTNQIVSLNANTFKNLTMLTQLYLNQNMLKTLPTGIFEELKILQILTLGENRIVSIDSNTFKKLPLLTHLLLHENDLQTLPTGVFEELKMTQILILSNNPIISLNDDMFKGLKNLHTLHLGHTSLKNVSSRLFKDLEKLQHLYLYGNQLSSIQADTLNHVKDLYSLWLEENQLINVDIDSLEDFSKLNILSLHTNTIKQIAVGLFKGLVNLRLLILNQNQISHLHRDVFQGLYQIRLLDVEKNMLVTIPHTLFRNLTFLELIILSGNQLKKLNTGLFQGFIHLTALHLDSNKFTSFDFDTLKGAINLNELSLNNNTIYSIANIPNGSHLEYLNLRQNPLTGITSQTLQLLSKEADLYVSQHEICECYAPNRDRCSAANKRSPYLTCNRLMSDRVLLAMMWLIGLGAFGGNIFVLIWRKKVTQKNKVQDFLLNNLAMADFLMGLYMIGIASADIYFGNYFPMQSETWRSGITCKILGSISITSSEASVFFVTLISFDRFLSIRFPYSIRKFGRKSIALVVTIVWIISLTLGVVPSVLSGINFKFYDNSHVCIGLPLALTKNYDTSEQTQVIVIQETAGYRVRSERYLFTTKFKGEVTGMYFSSAVFLGLNCLCYLFIVACYFEIVRAVQRSSKESGRTREMKEQIRLTLRVGMIVATDFLCWFPVIILGILVQTRVLTLPPSVYAWCVTFVLPFNSAINPFLYTISDIISNHNKATSDTKISSK